MPQAKCGFDSVPGGASGCALLIGMGPTLYRLNFTIYGMFAGVHLVAGGQIHRALIGRTFLQHYTMVYEGRTGTVTISN